MAVAGIAYERTTRGYPMRVNIDLRRHGSDEGFEDFLDRKEIEARQNDDVVSWNDAKAKLNKKHGL